MMLHFPEYMFGYLTSENTVLLYYSDIIIVMTDCNLLRLHTVSRPMKPKNYAYIGHIHRLWAVAF